MLLAAGLLLAGANAMAQSTTQTYPDPLDPKLATDPRNPPRFQKFTKPEQAQLGPPTALTPVPSGAGRTGFDATNDRKIKAKAKPKVGTDAQAQATEAAMPLTPSSYQKPFTTSANGAFAAAPGAPPEPEIGPIRRKPTKRKAHVEIDDPYEAIGAVSYTHLTLPT